MIKNENHLENQILLVEDHLCNLKNFKYKN